VVIRATPGIVGIVGGPKAISEQTVVAVRIPKAADAQAPVVPIGTTETEAEAAKSKAAIAQAEAAIVDVMVSEAVIQVVVDIVNLRRVQVIEAIVNVRAADVRHIESRMGADACTS